MAFDSFERKNKIVAKTIELRDSLRVGGEVEKSGAFEKHCQQEKGAISVLTSQYLKTPIFFFGLKQCRNSFQAL